MALQPVYLAMGLKATDDLNILCTMLGIRAHRNLSEEEGTSPVTVDLQTGSVRNVV